MISYRPTPELAAGRTGFRAALGAMVLAAVLGTAAFAPTGVQTATTAPTGVQAATIGTGTGVPASQAAVRREDDDDFPDEGSDANPSRA